MMRRYKHRVAPRERQSYFGFVQNALVATLAFMTAACVAPVETPTCLVPPPTQRSNGLREANIAVGIHDDGIRVRGFTDAAPAGAILEIQYGTLVRQVETDALGRFRLALSANEVTNASATTGAALSDLQIRVAGSVDATVFRVRADEGENCVVQEAIPTGTTPNDVVVHTCSGDRFAFVVHSSDGSVAAFSDSGKTTPPTISFPVDDNQRGANPWSIALDDEGTSAGITLFGQNSVAWVEPCTGRVRNIAEPKQADGTPLWIDIVPPVHLDLALDVDGDGTTEQYIERMLPRTPQGIVYVEGRWLVTFTNLLQVGANPIYGPGLVVAFGNENDKLVPVGHRILPCTNPQSITKAPDGSAWVSCTGALGPGANGFSTLSEGHLLSISASTLEITKVISMDTFGPGSPGFEGPNIIVGSLVRPQVALLSRDGTSIDDAHIIRLEETERVESVFAAIPYLGGLVLLSEYGTDRLHILDVEEKALNPWPFENGIAVGPGGMAFHGLQSVALGTLGSATASTSDAFALLAQSHELVPLRLWQVMGP